MTYLGQDAVLRHIRVLETSLKHMSIYIQIRLLALIRYFKDETMSEGMKGWSYNIHNIIIVV